MPEPRGALSWPLATWVAPVVPTLTLWLLVAVESGSDLAAKQTGGYLTGLGCALAVGVVGLLLTRTPAARLRGTGLGLAAGAAVTVPVLLVLVAT